MDDLFFWVILIGMLSVVGYVIWWGLLLFGIFKVAKYTNAQFERQLQQAMQLGQRLQNLPPQQRAVQSAQMTQMLARLNMQMGQIDQLSRQKYDVRMGELSGMAANAGINWTPPPY